MIYESDVSNLITSWKNELKQNQDATYKDGIRDCIYDLTMLIKKSSEEDALAKEAWEQQMADY